MRSWTTSATMSLSRCGRCRRVVWTSNHFSALLEACRRRCIHAPLRTHTCKCGALGRAELPTVLLTHCRMERSRRKWPHRLTDRCRAYCFIGLASLSFPKRSRNRQCLGLLFYTRPRLGLALQSLQFDDKETTMDPITAMREARTAVVGRHARHLLSNRSPALKLDCLPPGSTTAYGGSTRA